MSLFWLVYRCFRGQLGKRGSSINFSSFRTTLVNDSHFWLLARFWDVLALPQGIHWGQPTPSMGQHEKQQLYRTNQASMTTEGRHIIQTLVGHKGRRRGAEPSADVGRLWSAEIDSVSWQNKDCAQFDLRFIEHMCGRDFIPRDCTIFFNLLFIQYLIYSIIWQKVEVGKQNRQRYPKRHKETVVTNKTGHTQKHWTQDHLALVGEHEGGKHLTENLLGGFPWNWVRR